MIKKFSKRQLLDQCGFNAEETQIISHYQKKLPILVENDNVEGFCIDAHTVLSLVVHHYPTALYSYNQFGD